MTRIDFLILGFTLLMALWGYSRGVFASVLALAGFAAGAFAGGHLAPLLLTKGSHSPYAPLLALAGALFVGGVVSSVLEGAGLRLRMRLGHRLAAVDSMGGAVLIACLALGMAWLVGTTLAQASGSGALRHDIQRSRILRQLNTVLPPSGPFLNALARIDPLPQIGVPLGAIAAPNPAVVRDPEIRRAEGSVVRVTGTACGLGVEGSGWVAGNGHVVTAAHVVAGESDTTVQLDGQGPAYPAQVVWFDSHNDVAILSVPALRGVRALGLDTNAHSGSAAAVMGFPENGPFDIEPARLGATRTAISDDAYGRGPVMRSITALRGRVRPGNSGGPVVDGRGRVVTTIFGGAANGSAAGYGVPDSVVARALGRTRGPVSTGRCAG